MCSDKKEIVLGLFQQIEESISLLQQWNKDVKKVDDYLLSPEVWKESLAFRFDFGNSLELGSYRHMASSRSKCVLHLVLGIYGAMLLGVLERGCA